MIPPSLAAREADLHEAGRLLNRAVGLRCGAANRSDLLAADRLLDGQLDALIAAAIALGEAREGERLALQIAACGAMYADPEEALACIELLLRHTVLEGNRNGETLASERAPEEEKTT